MGDCILGLVACGGAQANGNLVNYYCNESSHSFVKEFTGWDQLKPTKAAPPMSKDINTNYAHECRSKCDGGKVPRYKRYCNNIGVQPVGPVLREQPRIKALAEDHKGVAVLAPFSVYNNRNWTLAQWLTLECLLIKSGFKTVIIDNVPARCVSFRGEALCGRKQDFLLSVLLNAGVIISVDNGIAHLAAALCKRPVVLCGPCKASDIYFAKVIEIVGPGGVNGLPCAGCYWGGVYTRRCDLAGCASLQSITPEQVMETICKQQS